MIQPTSRATANTANASAATTIPSSMSLKREIGPGHEGPPGSLTIGESYKVILNRLLIEMFKSPGPRQPTVSSAPVCCQLARPVTNAATECLPANRAVHPCRGQSKVFSAKIYGDAALAISWTISKRRPDQPGPRPGPDLRAIQTYVVPSAERVRRK
jgi:hypothetical protein